MELLWQFLPYFTCSLLIFQDFVVVIGANLKFDFSSEICDKSMDRIGPLAILCKGRKTGRMDKRITVDELRSVYDYIVVGTGSAGAILASKLSEDPNIKVLALEAGFDEKERGTWWSHVPSMALISQNTDIDWQYRTEPQKQACQGMKDNVSFWPRGKVLGGSSVLNYMLYVRGNPKDYDYWKSKHGADGWGYADLLKYFKKVESIHFSSRDSDIRGKRGPIAVRLAPKTKGGTAFLKAAHQFGFPHLSDYNGRKFEGFGRTQMNINDDDRRESTSKKYLYPAMSRQNLHVMTEAHVAKVLIDNRKQAYGVEFLHNDVTFIVNASKEVILSAGAIGTPQIMQLSGLGPKSLLRTLGITVRADIPAVGMYLKDHILTPVAYSVDKEAVKKIKSKPKLHSPFGRVELDDEDSLFNAERIKFGKEVTWATSEIMGYARSNDRLIEPDIQLMYRADDIFLNGRVLKYFNVRDDIGKSWYYNKEDNRTIVTAIVGLMQPKSDGYVQIKSADPLIHPKIQPNYLGDARDIKAMMRGLRFMDVLMRKTTSMRKFNPQWMSEEIGGCRKHRVHGISHLRIADASIFPEIPSGNTNLPAMVVGLKAADLILEDMKMMELDLLRRKPFFNQPDFRFVFDAQFD